MTANDITDVEGGIDVVTVSGRTSCRFALYALSN
jgi:hypothetical protein